MVGAEPTVEKKEGGSGVGWWLNKIGWGAIGWVGDVRGSWHGVHHITPWTATCT